MVNLDPEIFLKRYPKELSGGQQQRVGVVRALAADPPVLLMDEPFGAIDPINREVIQDEFMKLQAALKKTVVFVSHDIDEAVKMALAHRHLPRRPARSSTTRRTTCWRIRSTPSSPISSARTAP